MNFIRMISSYFYKYYFYDSKEIITFYNLHKYRSKYFNDFILDYKNMQNYIIKYINQFDNYNFYLCGDSVILATDQNEDDKETLGQKISKESKANILSFNCGAFSSLCYYDVFSNIPKIKNKKIFLIEFNLRSLSDEWFLRPSYQFNNLRIICNSLKNYKKFNFLEKFYQSYFFYYKYSDLMYNNTIFFIDNILKNYNIPYRKKLLLRTSFHYCFPKEFIKIRITHLCKVIKLLHKKNFIPIVFITPLNYSEKIDISEKKILIENINEVIKFCNRYSAITLDFSTLFGSDAFTDAEHLRSKARQILAEQLIKKLSIRFNNTNPVFTSYGLPNLICIRPNEMEYYANICKKI